MKLHDWSGKKYTADEVIDAFGVQQLAENVVPLGPTALTKPAFISDSALGNEFVEEGDVLRKLTLEELRDALQYIDPGTLSYDGDNLDSAESETSWLAIIMAIHSEYPGEDGKALADEWSRRGGERYKPGEVDKRWSGFSDKPGYTVGTIVKFARLGGWKPETGVTERDRFLSEWGTNYAVVRVGNKVRVLVENKGATHTPEQNAFDLYTFEDFKKWTATQKFKDSKDGQDKPIATAWFYWPYRKEYLGIGCYPPGASSVPPKIYNSWRGFAVEPKPGD